MKPPRWTNHPLRVARQRAGVSQSGLARDAGVTRSTVTAIEQGRTRIPKPSTLVAFAKIVKMTPDKLRTEIVAWGAQESEVALSKLAAATLTLDATHIKAYRSFAHWRAQIVDSPTAMAVLLRINSDVVLRYEQGRDLRGMSDRLAGALMNNLGLSSAYVEALQKLPVSDG